MLWIGLMLAGAGYATEGEAEIDDAGDWKDLRVRALPQRWEFDAGWPEGWVRTGGASVEEGRLSVGDTRGKIDVACTPILQVGAGSAGAGEGGGAGMRVRWSRAADILSMDPPTWSVLEVREVGEALGLPMDMVWRQPFPGPGLTVRILGEVTPERADRLREADAILTEELSRAGLLGKRAGTSQAFAVLLPVRSVGVMGDQRTYQETCAIRAVVTDDFMTADWARLPYDVLATISNRIINEVRGINRVVYDISSKPPATIEWE